MSQAKQSRVIAYVDGLNLYYGMMAMGLRGLLWLDISRLIGRLVRPDQSVRQVRYFTARVSSPEDKRLRQNAYLDALGTLKDVSIHEGRYQKNRARCPSCNRTWPKPEEKMTDVNIATEMLKDAFQDRFDTAMLISADSDLVPPIKAIRSTFPKKRVIVVFPPKRFSFDLQSNADASFHIWESKLRRSLLPSRIIRADGFELICPADYWHSSFGPRN